MPAFQDRGRAWEPRHSQLAWAASTPRHTHCVLTAGLLLQQILRQAVTLGAISHEGAGVRAVKTGGSHGSALWPIGFLSRRGRSRDGVAPELLT